MILPPVRQGIGETRMKKARLGIAAFISLLMIVIAGGMYYLLLTQWHTEAFAAGKTNTVKVYRIAGEDAEDSEGAKDTEDAEDSEKQSEEPPEELSEELSMEEIGTLIRGSAVTRYRKSVNVDGVTYCRIKVDQELITINGAGEEGDSADIDVDDFDLYMTEESLADTMEGAVLETEVYARTPATIYVEETGPAIASFAAKGTCLKVTGHDKLLENGFINKYKVEYTDSKDKKHEGYVYGKYMVDNQKDADAVYNEHGEYDAAKGDNFRFELYGGKAKNLDYYPYERTPIEGNEFCSYARTMYLNGEAAVHPDNYINIIKDTDCNAVVMDLKDGYLAFQSNVAKELSPTSYKSSYARIEDYRESVEKLRATGVYLIGRIVVFNDPQYAADHPENCIKYGGSQGWPSAFSRDVWEYNVRLAQEAVKEFGFNEIQFDYVRFPESTYEMSKSGTANFRNKYKEEKAQAIQNFCFYATDQLREVGAYTSVDVFGESAYSYVTAYGQYWMAISNVVDAISAMPYTDHFDGEKPWEDPYSSVLAWAYRAAKQQKRLQNPAAARTWITGYNTPYWDPKVNYNTAKMKDQIRALERAGLDGGFIPWNALSDSNKYRSYKAIWNE